MKKLCIFSLLSVLLTGCHKNHESPCEPLSKRTVIVYMSGENDLGENTQYSNVKMDLQEMQQGSLQLANDERLVAFVDQRSSEPPYIVEIKDNMCDTVRVFSEDFYASDPARFREVIEWIEKKYPAADDDYALVLWGHATGWIVVSDTIAQSRMAPPRRAYGLDYGWDNLPAGRIGSRWMNITQMARALEGLPRFRYILADCCCFMCAEVAYELRHVTDYLIGSPAEIPNDGAPYHLLMKPLFSESDRFYRDIIDTYFDYYKTVYATEAWTPFYLRDGGYSVPLCVVDMNYIEELAQQTRNVLMSPDNYALETIPFYFASEKPVMYDIRSLMERHLPSADYNSWMASFRRAVPYSRLSARWMTSYSLQRNKGFYVFQLTEDIFGGLSMFVPSPDYYNTGSIGYNEGIKSMEWYKAVGWNRFED